MTIDDVRRKSLRGIKDVSAYTANYDFSDCVYDAIQEMQTNSLCSRVEIRKRIGINGELSQVNVIDGGSGYTYPPTVTITDNLFADCVYFNGSTQRGDVTEFSIGTTHTIEWTMDSETPPLTELDWIVSKNFGGSLYNFTGFYGSSNLFAYGLNDGISNYNVSVTMPAYTYGTKHICKVVRDVASVSFFFDGTQVGTTQTLNVAVQATAFTVANVSATHPFYRKLGKLRIYNHAADQNDIDFLWNGGYGNVPLPGSTMYVDWEFDGTGGTGTTETDKSGNGRTLTLVNSPTRMSWSSGEPNSTSKAVAEAIIENGSVTSVVLTSPGIGYFSQPTITFTGGNGTGALAVAPISGTTFQKTITAKYSSSTSSEIPIECLYVDAMFKVGTDGTKTPIKLKDRYTVSAEKDTGVSSTSSEDLSGAVLWDRNNIQIFTPWDMTDCTLEMWIRFQIPYVQDANVGTNANSYIDTVPVQFQNRLISGVKYHIYEAMEELSGFSGKYQPMMKVFGEQWFHRDLPYVKQEVNGTKAAETVHYVKPATVAGLE